MTPEVATLVGLIINVVAALGTMAAAIVAALALWIAHHQLGEARRQRSQEMGLQYVARYWEISDGLLHSPKGSAEHRRHQHRYVLLCEDEFEAVNGGWLDLEMWEDWHSWLAEQPGRYLTEQDLKDCAHALAPFKNLRHCLGAPNGHTWAACPANDPRRPKRRRT